MRQPCWLCELACRLECGSTQVWQGSRSSAVLLLLRALVGLFDCPACQHTADGMLVTLQTLSL